MAAADVMAQPGLPTSTFRPIIEPPVSQTGVTNVRFDPELHISYEPPESIINMTDIGYKDDTGISPVAVSQPFRLFSTAAVQKIREEVLSTEVMSNYSVKSNIAACQLRGYAPHTLTCNQASELTRLRCAPFTYAAFRNERLLEIISKIASVDLIPQMDYEIGHVNISVKSGKEAENERAEFKRNHDDPYDHVESPWQDDKPIVGWHRDSYPFVCVVMLSDCSQMIGGETAMRTADGRVMKVRGPDMGCAVVMQGRHITHQALRALGTQERITLVTSLRPKSPLLREDSNLDTVRGISDVPELHYQYATYRLEILQARIEDQLAKLRKAHEGGGKLDTEALKGWLGQQEKFLGRTNGEIWEDGKVVAGRQPELWIEDVGSAGDDEQEKVRDVLDGSLRVKAISCQDTSPINQVS